MTYLLYYLIFGFCVCVVWFGLTLFQKSGTRTDQPDQTVRPDKTGRPDQTVYPVEPAQYVESSPPRPAEQARYLESLDAVNRLREFFGIAERDRQRAAVEAVDELHAGIHEYDETPDEMKNETTDATVNATASRATTAKKKRV